MKTGPILASERAQYTDPETGRAVTLWTGAEGTNMSFYYHQNAFDAPRGLVYFVSARSGSMQIWRVSIRDGRLTQVSDFEGFGEFCQGTGEREASYSYAVHVSRYSGRIHACGRGRIVVIDPDTLQSRTLWEEPVHSRGPDTRYHRSTYVFPSCDDRWVYSSSVYCSEAEFAAARTYTEAVAAAYKEAGLAMHTANYPYSPHGLSESPLEHVIVRVEAATGKIEELWRGHWWIQHVQPSPTDPDLATFIWASVRRSKPKYFLLRAGEQPRALLRDEENFCVFHDFWRQDGTKWYAHSCENLRPGEGYAPIPGQMRFYVCEVDIGEFQRTDKAYVKRWYETAGESHVHMHLNIAPDGSFLVGDGQSDCPYIGKLDWQSDGTLKSSRLCRAGYFEWGTHNEFGETSPNVQVSPDGRSCFFTTYREGRTHLASVEI